MEPVRTYHENGQLKSETWLQNDQPHREDGPAITEYYPNGQLMCEVYYRNDELYRTDGPAVVEYYDNGQIKSESYHQYNTVHRADGPAWKKWHKNGQLMYEAFYLAGKNLSEEEFTKAFYKNAVFLRKNTNSQKAANLCITNDAIYLFDQHGEIVSWTEDEWLSDPSIIISIVNAIKILYEDGSSALREIINI